jgi:prolipoprotein diacylglyceryl transferase
MTGVLASIPSPPFNSFEIGPLVIHVYGILMGIAVATAYVVTVRRYERFGGDPLVAGRVAVWAIVLGFVGARLAFVITRLDRFQDDWLGVIRIWEGGIAMFGGLTFGFLAVMWSIRRNHGSFPMFADAVALGLPAAQAVGRWGNYFNQELFGTPTTLPWGLEIDRARRPPQFVDAETFHPTFLYESLWSVATILALLWIEKRFALRRGSLLLCYLAAYGTIRFVLELIRTDTTFRFLGLSRNGWVSLAVVLGAATWLAIREWGARRNLDRVASGEPAGSDR